MYGNRKMGFAGAIVESRSSREQVRGVRRIVCSL
jgi:hypothetical protein